MAAAEVQKTKKQARDEDNAPSSASVWIPSSSRYRPRIIRRSSWIRTTASNQRRLQHPTNNDYSIRPMATTAYDQWRLQRQNCLYMNELTHKWIIAILLCARIAPPAQASNQGTADAGRGTQMRRTKKRKRRERKHANANTISLCNTDTKLSNCANTISWRQWCEPTTNGDTQHPANLITIIITIQSILSIHEWFRMNK